MRILIALTYYRPHYSGLTIYTEREALALAERGHQVSILTSRFDKSLPARENCDGVQVIRMPVWFHLSKGVIMPGMPFWAWKLARQADVVHLHLPQLDAAPISLLARLLGKPVVVTYHCDLHLPAGLIHRLANLASNLANRITGWAADVIVHNSRDYAEDSAFLRPYLGKLRTAYPPVEVAHTTPADIEAFRHKYNVQSGQRVIGMVARLATEKGVEYLAQALPLVQEKHPEARIFFVGPYQDVLGEEKYAARLAPIFQRLGEHWTFLGVISPTELSAFYQVCEVTVLPSLNSTDSFGIVQVESMRCGTPVVASNIPGVRVPVQTTGMGLVVPSANAPALAQAITAILDDPASFRGDPQALLDQSTPQALAQIYEEIFKSFLR